MKNEYDIKYVPFTTKMTKMEQLFHNTLQQETLKYPQAVKKWLKTNYSIGTSYAHLSINKTYTKTLLSDRKSIKNLLTGVDKILNKFEKTIKQDLHKLIEENKNKTTQQLKRLLNNFTTHHYTTPISAKTRSEMIARTEIQRSFNNGTIQTYANYGLNSFNIINYNDKGICETCISLIQDNPYTLEEIIQLLPVHPYCRCLCVLYNTNIEIDTLELIENPIIVNMFNE